MERTRWLGLVAVMMMGGSGCVVEVDCIDDDNDGVCWEDDCNDNDPSIGVCGCFDDDNDGFCWEDDCDDLDPTVGACNCAGDFDCDGIDDTVDCYNDFTNEYVCQDVACTSADNICEDPWYIVFCDEASNTFFGSDCNAACTTDERVYGATCGGTPAVSGECSQVDGACLCWCEEAFDRCVNDFTVEYLSEGVTYQVDCKEYCGGTCDQAAGACACP